MSEKITISHTCETCGMVVYTPAKDRRFGKVSKGHPEGWELIKNKWCCNTCSQGWHRKEAQAWQEYQKEREGKGKTTKEK